ncbi:MAG: prepilin peptidase [Patescibacteria group bacterium]
MYYLFCLYFFALGSIFGSFFSCLAWRLHLEESTLPSSHCDFCGRRLKWFENVPVLSFLLLRGRCSSCHKKINWQYFAAELFGGILFLLAFIVFFRNPLVFEKLLFSGRGWFQFAIQLFSLAILFFVMIYDGRYYLVSLPITIGASLLLYFLHVATGIQWFAPLVSALIGGGFFFIQYFLTKGKGIGEGDIYLGILLGMIFPEYLHLFLLLAVIISYFIGAATGLTLVAFGRKKLGSTLPLGLFLAIGGMITILFGGEIITWYLSLL